MEKIKALAFGLSISLSAMAVAAENQVRWMYGKWCSIGTSITWCNDHPNGKFTQGYQTRVCEVLRFEDFKNVGINGAHIAKSLGSAVPADYYTIEHGVNDWGSTVPVGTIDDYRNNTKNGTFCASYRQMIDEIRGLSPAAKIVLCTPRKAIGGGWFPASSSDPCTNKGTPGIRLKDYVDAVKAIAAEESLPVADFYATCGEDADLPSLSWDNAVHPNDAGYQLMADELVKAFSSVDSLPEPAIPAGVKFRKSVGLLTEIVTSGTAWELRIASSGLLTVKTVGDSRALDLSETATGGPVGIRLVSGIPDGVSVVLPGGALRLADAALKWDYEGTTLTEIAATGTPWVFTLAPDGKLTRLLQVGDNPTIDLRNATLPANAPAITEWGFSSWSSVGKAVTTCRKVIFPEGLAKIGYQALYQWTSLSEIVWPEALESIGSSAFEGHAVVNMAIPESVKSIWSKALLSSSMVSLRLPQGLQTLGSLQGCPNLETIEGGLPQGISNLVEKFLWGCQKLTTPIEVGFGVDEMGRSIPVTFGVDGGKLGWTFIKCNCIPSIRYGPGVESVPFYACYGITGLKHLELGENLTVFRDSTKGCSSLTNIVIKTKETLSLGPLWESEASFSGANLEEISWNGWFEVSSGRKAFSWADRQVRFVVPGDNVFWAAFMLDATRMTPWATVVAEHPEYEAAYYEKYGTSARAPEGLSVARTGFPATYIVSDGTELDGHVLFVSDLDPQIGTVTATPAPAPGGVYMPGTEVTVSIRVEDGVEFLGWTGDVAEADRTKTSIVLLMDSSKSIAASVRSDRWFYADGFLSDGGNRLAATGSEDAITVTTVDWLDASGIVDLSKPINNGRGKVVKIANAFNGNRELAKIVLPEGLEEIGVSAFSDCTSLTAVENAFPHSFRKFSPDWNGNRSFFGCSSLASPIEIGFGEDDGGNPIPVNMSPDGPSGYCWIFYKARKIPAARFGPGIATLPPMPDLGECVRHCELNVLTNKATFTACTNVAINTKDKIYLQSGGWGSELFGGTSLREIAWKCWFEVAPGTTAFKWADRQVRFVVPRANAAWRSFAADRSNVTPWSGLDAAAKQAYRERFGASAVKPYGLITGGACGLPQTWLIIDGFRPGLAISAK